MTLNPYLRVLRRFVRRRYASELGDLALACLLVETLGVPRFGFGEGNVDVDFDEGEGSGGG